MDINKATYNKYTDSPINLSQVMSMGDTKSKSKQQNSASSHNNSNSNNQPLTPPPSVASTSPTILRNSTPLENRDGKSKALVIGTDPTTLDPVGPFELRLFRAHNYFLLSFSSL